MWSRHLLALCLFCSLVACGDGSKSKPGSVAVAPLVIGTDATYPPFEFVDKQGQISGVSVEIGREIGKALGREVVFKNINFDGLILALKTSSIDLIISSMTANDERRRSIDFSEPYVKTGLSLLLSAKSDVQKAEDLRTPGRRIVVRLGTTGEMWARKELSQAQFVSVDTDAACVLEVVNGNVDAWVYDQISVMNYHEKHKEQTRAILAPLREEVWAVGIRQGDVEMKTQVDRVISRMQSDGSFGHLAERFLATERALMKSQGLPFVFELNSAP